MVQYELPPELQLKSKSTKIVPPLFRENFNPRHSHNFISFPEGGYLNQHISVPGFEGFLQTGHFKVNRPFQLHAVTPKDNILIHYLLKGRVLCKLYKGTICVLNEGHCNLFFSPAFARNYLFLEKGEYFSCYISVQEQSLKGFHLKNKKLNELAGLLHKAENRTVACPPIRIDYRAKILLMEMIRFQEGDLERPLFLTSRIAELVRLYLHDLLKNDSIPDINRKDVAIIVEIKAYIRFNLGTPLSISLLSRKHQISMTALKVIFRTCEGMTINEFIVQERMHSAFSMLIHQDRSIREIGQMVGYKEVSYFSYAFNRFFGHPPGYFRNNI